MPQIITLACQREVSVLNNDLSVSLANQELTFRFIGLHNNPIPSDYRLFTMPFDFELSATLLGDGFQMLAQTSGSCDNPIEIGRCADNDASYRIYPQTEAKRYYNYLVIEDSAGYTLLGFTSCHRFAGYFQIINQEGKRTISANIDGEKTYPLDWDSQRLESVAVLSGPSLSLLFEEYSQLIKHHHPTKSTLTQKSPIGWCSWYAYYDAVTENNIAHNVKAMKLDLSYIDWVLLDDGYQAFMGDWLTPSSKFSHGVKAMIQAIIKQGKKPAIWLAPFIVEPKSALFKQHPDWFVRHESGELLKAEDVTYGGWRCTPWYVLDTSNTEVQDHLTHIFKTMHEDWGVQLFKLDANYWGTLKGKRDQTGVTGIQAYRMGMKAIEKGAGDAWILGCNAPMWPSLGLVDAMRVSDDVERSPARFCQIAQETFFRSWQHRQLWHIDPDCATFVSLANQSTERQYYDFHRTALLASGGLLLSGDPLPELTPYAKSSLTKLVLRQKHNQKASKFTSLSLSHAFLPITDRNDLHCLFNYHSELEEFTLTSKQAVYWYDYWSGKKLTSKPTNALQISLEKGPSSRAIITAIAK
ncbi:glycoside hydrolase family 36 protein [Vibrio genomosp. F10]|uniref:glycoside hydrolase family 36 protein n=1 Tax=Vibrio genomosp. F10 TaxID=723171 RepID=UPI0003142C34|nr:alpha-galactosidase [Vibrio genomosp. F10]OEE96340.1 alpha-galactosidase [Vibrio genomosp. F10 str. 9ZD137]